MLNVPNVPFESTKIALLAGHILSFDRVETPNLVLFAVGNAMRRNRTTGARQSDVHNSVGAALAPPAMRFAVHFQRNTRRKPRKIGCIFIYIMIH